MKTITLSALLLSMAITGCQKQQASDVNIDETTVAIEKSKRILGSYNERLYSEFTAREVRKQILCIDYPREYKMNYVPNMLKLNSKYTEAMLLNDMNNLLDHYKELDDIQC